MYVPPKWREGLIVNLFKKGDREDPGNYRGITLYVYNVSEVLYMWYVYTDRLKFVQAVQI